VERLSNAGSAQSAGMVTYFTLSGGRSLVALRSQLMDGFLKPVVAGTRLGPTPGSAAPRVAEVRIAINPISRFVLPVVSIATP
jgi:hypothetical protein